MPVLQQLWDPQVLQFELYEFFEKFQYVIYLVMCDTNVVTPKSQHSFIITLQHVSSFCFLSVKFCMKFLNEFLQVLLTPQLVRLITVMNLYIL